MSKSKSTMELLKAAQLSRRTVMKAAAATGAMGFAAPLLSQNALSSSGELNLLMWSDEFPGDVIRTSRRPAASR